MPVIIVQSPSGESKIELDAAVVSLGRGVDNDIQINDVRASRKHCQLVQIVGSYKLVDLASGNGTKVNGVKISEHVLRSGDMIQIGATTILFANGDPPAAARPAAASTVQAPPMGNPFAATQVITAVHPSPASFADPLAAVDAVPQMVVPVTPIASAPSAPPPTPTTRSFSRPAGKTTARMGRTTGRTAMGGKKGMTSRSALLTKKKKWTPGKILLVFGLAFVGGILFLFMQSMNAPSTEFEKEKAIDLNGRATKEAEAGDYKKARETLKELIAYAKDKEHLKKFEASATEALKNVDENILRQDEAPLKFKELQARFDTVSISDKVAMNDLKKEVQKAKGLYALTKYKKQFEELENHIKLAVSEGSSQPEKDKVAELNGKFYDLVKVNKHYAQALKEWKDFKNTLGSSSVDIIPKADNRISEINAAAREEVESLKKRAEEKVKSESKDAAVAFLEAEKARFAGTEGETPLDDVIQDIKNH